MKKKDSKADQELLKKYKEALVYISKMGDGIKDGMIDWEKIGQFAKSHATQALVIKCEACGK